MGHSQVRTERLLRYGPRFKLYSDAVINFLRLRGRKKRLFQCLDASGYDVPTVFQAGTDSMNNVNAVGWHYYQVARGNYSTLGRSLMNHSAIVHEMKALSPFIAYLDTRHEGPIPFVVDEIGNSLDPHQDFSFQAVLGSALWQVDWQLQALTIGVARTNWQQILRAAYGMWLPRESGGFPPQTLASFYAMPFVGDFIGATGGSTRITELPVEGQNQQVGVVAYAAYDRGGQARVALINFDVWDMPGANTTQGPGGSNGDGKPERPFATISLTGLRTESIEVRYLNSPNGAHANATTITYGGSQWTAESKGKEIFNVQDDTQQLRVKKGKVDIMVEASSAAIVFPRR